MSLQDIIKFSGFRGPRARRNWLYLGLILAYVLVSIWLSHFSEIKARRLSELNRENRRLRSEYVSMQSRLATKQLRSQVYRRLKDKGFVIPKRAPVYIVKDEN
ncbi:MAG: hypothetical protein GXO27_01060 [Chlorobi bacterium]|nr:hypothetical protein [Chlorobiota bacterium]